MPTLKTTALPSRKPSYFLSGLDMLCFSHDWGSDPLSKTHLMRLLARENRVLWVNSIGYRAPSATKADLLRAFKKLIAATQPLSNPIPNLYVLNPLVIPAYGSASVRRLNSHWLGWQVRRAMRRLGFRRPISWIFNPAAALVAGHLGEDLVIYYCVDEYASFAGVPSQALANLERHLLQRADVVFCSAERLLQSKSQWNPRTFLVRHGVDYEHFSRALSESTRVPQEIAGLPRPIIGYFGLIAPDWVDLDLLRRVAKHFSCGSLVLLGKTAMDTSLLQKVPNIHLLGRKPYEDLPAYCKGFDVALVPFPVSEVTLNANPLKAREYLAAGLPVVSTPIPEVTILEHCRIANTADEFILAIEDALLDPGPSPQRSSSVRGQSWQARLVEIQTHLTHLFDEHAAFRRGEA